MSEHPTTRSLDRLAEFEGGQFDVELDGAAAGPVLVSATGNFGGAAHVAEATVARLAPTPAAIIVDANTNNVLYSSSADVLRSPASLTKIMTLYVLFAYLGVLDNTPCSASANGRPAFFAFSLASCRRCTQKVHFSITPRLRTVTSGFSTMRVSSLFMLSRR